MVSQEPAPAIEWSDAVLEVPLADLSGSWLFVPGDSDPMVEDWRDREILYVITQVPDRIVLDFRPAGGSVSARGYRWDGSVVSLERDRTQIRERARWTDGGRVLEIEGRRWADDDPSEITSYLLRYRLDGPDRLIFVQADAYGETIWRFRRR
jgi:hypothetical protein